LYLPHRHAVPPRPGIRSAHFAASPLGLVGDESPFQRREGLHRRASEIWGITPLVVAQEGEFSIQAKYVATKERRPRSTSKEKLVFVSSWLICLDGLGRGDRRREQRHAAGVRSQSLSASSVTRGLGFVEQATPRSTGYSPPEQPGWRS